MSADDPQPDDLGAFVEARLRRYADLWSEASTKLSAGDYHADDLVDDWFRLVGFVARDATAAASLIVRSGSRPG